MTDLGGKLQKKVDFSEGYAQLLSGVFGDGEAVKLRRPIVSRSVRPIPGPDILAMKRDMQVYLGPPSQEPNG